MTASELLDHTQQRLREWVTSVLTGVHVSSLTPSDTQQVERGICLYLLELIPAPPSGNTRRLPLQLSLRYLVTAWAKEPDESNRMLSELAFAAMENRMFDIDLEPIPVAAWVAFGIRPRPSFAIRVPLRLERPELTETVVRQPIDVKSTPLTVLEGVVLTSSDVPIVGARIEVPSLRLSQVTDSRGRFSLTPVPAQPRPKQLTLRAKGREMVIDIPDDQPASGREPFVIRFDPT